MHTLTPRSIFQLIKWHQRRYAAPPPHYVKHMALRTNGAPDAVWVESGTYHGQTTSFLSKHSRFVYSIEPEATLFSRAVDRFRSTDNVKIINGTSEEVFPSLLGSLQGDVNFWLDGHYSAGETFKGTSDTPVVAELAAISENRVRFNRVSVLVDDVRCFNPLNPHFADYPPVDFLVDWARGQGFAWHIEHDIFVARNF